MSPTRRSSTIRRAAVLGAMVVAAAGCATRHRDVLAPLATVSAQIIWHIEPNDLLNVKVFREPELSSTATVGLNGTAFFTGIGRIAVAGLMVDSLELLLNARYATLLRDPAVQVTMQREITVYGQIRVPGVYAVDPGTTLLGLIARAGGPAGLGQAGAGSAPTVTLETSTGLRLQLPREARLGSLDVHRADAVFLSESGFFARNSTSIYSASLVITTISTLIGLILVLTR